MEYKVEYDPTGPTIQRRFVEELMFDNYTLINWFYGRACERVLDASAHQSELYKKDRYVLLLIKKGETRKSNLDCPQCGIRKILYFSTLGNSITGYSGGSEFTCCDDARCKERLRAKAKETATASYALHRISFSVILSFRENHRQKIGGVLREIFEIPKSTPKKKVFDFFFSKP